MKKRNNIHFNKSIAFLLLFSISFITLSTISTVSADSSVIYVNGSHGDDANDGLSWDTAKLSIKNATGTVTVNGTVNIANGVYTGENNTKITIDRKMTIKGQSQKGTIINGTGTNWIFKVNSGVNVTIQNLTIANGYTNGAGGAIWNAGTLTVTSSTFAGNRAYYDGGAIENDGTITSLSGCTFTNNTVDYGYGEGGAIYNADTITSLNGCTFTNNRAVTGGAINNAGTITSLSGCTFTNNTANYGGAINGNGAINNCTFTNNTAVTGGAINGNGAINNCTFTNNTANGDGVIYSSGTLTVTGSTFAGNHADRGVIYNTGTISLSNCTFTNNTAVNGGAISNFGGTITSLSGCTFTNNTAYNGGAIYNTNTITSLSDCTFTGNKAANGGAIYNFGGTITLSGCTFTNNTAFYGGAIYNDNATLTATGNTFKGNTATIAGGVLYNDNSGTATLNFNRITGNNPNLSEIYGKSGTVNALFNWWGSNDNPAVHVNSNVNVTSWLVLRVTSNPNTILNGKNSTVTATLCYDNLNNYHNPASGHVPDGTPVIFTGTLGSLNPASTTLVNGSITSIFTANSAGTASISAAVDEQTVNTPITVDAIPTVTSIDPANNAKINAANKIITVTFNKSIQAGTAYNSITVTGPSGNIDIIKNINGSVLTLTPTSNYVNGVYNVNIPVNAVTDLTGNSLTAAFDSSFTVDIIPPSVTANHPSGTYNNIKTVALTATDNLDPNPRIYYSINKGVTWYHQTKTVTLNLNQGKNVLMFYAKDAAGNQCPTQTATYNIDTIAPKIITTSPKNRAIKASRTSTIAIRLSEKVKSGINWSKIVVKNKYGKTVRISKWISGNILYIKTKRKRSSYSYYTIYVPKSGLKDNTGNNFAGYTFRFKTGRY